MEVRGSDPLGEGGGSVTGAFWWDGLEVLWLGDVYWAELFEGVLWAVVGVEKEDWSVGLVFEPKEALFGIKSGSQVDEEA